MTNQTTQSKQNQYTSIINHLMSNDHNATWDEILQDNNNDLEDSINELHNAISDIIGSNDYEESELTFYRNVLNDIEKIL